jgi:hypothetical protein
MNLIILFNFYRIITLENTNKDFIRIVKISDENKYNQAINEVMNILKTSKRTLKDKELF